MGTQNYPPTASTATAGLGDSSGTTAQAQQAAVTAKDEGRHVADVAKGEAQQVAGEAREQARHLLEEARSQIEGQSRSQLDSLGSLLKSFGDDLEQMARNSGTGSGLAQDLVTQVSGQARSLSSQIQGREPAELLDQVRGFARRKPGTFLLGALAAGVVAGRLTRGAKDAQSSQGSASASQPVLPPTEPPAGYADTPVGGTPTGDPLAGIGHPEGTPAYPEGTRSTETAWGTPAPATPPPPTTPTGSPTWPQQPGGTP